MSPTRSRLLAIVSALVVLGTLVGVGSAIASTTSSNPTVPTAGAKDIDNPGAIRLGTDASGNQRWLILRTAGWSATDALTVGTLEGTWSTIQGKRLLKGKPDWMTSGRAMWAPSALKRPDGRYVLFYAAEPTDATGEDKCIGVAVSDGTTVDPAVITKPYVFDQQDASGTDYPPLVCWGHSPADNPSSDPAFDDRNKDYTIIDPTPTEMDTDGVNGPETYLTYKTALPVSGIWHTTLRMVRLDRDHPELDVYNGTAKSKQLTEWTNASIEENPVMVQRGPNAYTLFSSRGWYGNDCTNSGPHPYQTYYRNSSSPWNWGSASIVKLDFPSNFNSCGSGNAFLTKTVNGSWRIFFNGKYEPNFNPPYDNWKMVPSGMYVGNISYAGGDWTVTKVYQ